ncbi:MAG: TaqI-like C-terminal specificity domain-containing protein [Saprospiraceae bacterium]
MNLEFLEKPYNHENWKSLVRMLFPAQSDLFSQKIPIPVDSERIESFAQFGTIHLNDQLDTRLALFEIRLQPNTTKLQINRVALNKIVSKINEDSLLTGAFAVYVDDEQGKWRFSFIAKRRQYATSGEVETWETEPKRYTYVFGAGEQTRTAEERFRLLAEKPDKTLDDIVDAFSVEKISREFFDRYKKLYEELWHHLSKPGSGAHTIFKISPESKDEKVTKPLRDFAKRLMGRLVFLHFLQKKGWMGCPTDSKEWKNGDRDFIRHLFQNSPSPEHFHSNELRQLFFHTLNERRENDVFQAPWGAVRIPYLNGGLFDDDTPKANQLDFPAELFKRIFDFFSQYNFTIDENAPNDQEVGVDPEMLGHIFENLLEENREKQGAYYTPKEIVHYMCRESLLLYLKMKLLPAQKPPGIVWSDSRESDENELAEFVRYKRRGAKNNFIHKNAQAIERALLEVRICDPAIGSGAFPMGLLYEIFHCQVELDLTEDYAQLKKDIIHHCIYGVDRDKGAVDIARLRFWLALVVDEPTPQPLPNLDFKIMQGDSLLESFEGIDLSNLFGENGKEQHSEPAQIKLFDTVEEPTVQFGEKDKAKLERWLDTFFEPKNAGEKAELQAKIDRKINEELNEAIRRHKQRLLIELGEQKRALEREQSLRRPGAKQQKEITRLEAEVATCEARQVTLAEWQQRPERPYFLWHTWFRGVFERGGFDIVIGNPPYIQLQRLGQYADTLQRSNYSTFERTGDLYCLFYERALRMLADSGVLAFITSNSWLKTRYGAALRKYFVEHSTPVAILNFEDAQLFKAAIVETNILLALKGKYPLNSRGINIDAESDSAVPLYQQLYNTGLILNDLSEKEWIIGDKESAGVKTMMENGNQRIGEIGVKINFGVKTGFNEAFIIDEKIKNELIKKERKSAEIIKPVLRGRDVQKYSVKDSNLWIINTHNGLKKTNIPKIDAQNDYPIVYEYLLKYQAQLEKRQDKGSHWTNLRNCAYLEEFDKPKILWGELSDAPKFSYEDKGYYPEATLFLLTGENLKFLLAILNSKAGEWYFNQIATTSGMGTNRWKKYKIEELPIPLAHSTQENTIERLVEYILWLKPRHLEQTSPDTQLICDYLEQVVDGAVFELYFSEQLRKAGCVVLEHLEGLPALETGKEEETIRKVFQRIFDKDHPVRNALFYMRTVPEVKIILDGLKSPGAFNS